MEILVGGVYDDTEKGLDELLGIISDSESETDDVCVEIESEEF